jgi:hypothetical protein
MKINNDQASSSVGLIIGVVIVIYSLTYEIGSLSSPSVGFFPLTEGIAIIVLSLFGLAYASFQCRRGIGWSAVIQGVRWQRPLVVFVSLLAYALSLRYLGFIVTTILFIGFLIRVLEHQRWFVVIIFSVFSAFASYLFFETFLKSQLPSGFLGF